MALNIGTKEQPKFGRREFLCHVDGSILCTRDHNEVVATGENFNAVNASGAGDFHTYLNPVDWDGDGVLDIIATDSSGECIFFEEWKRMTGYVLNALALYLWRKTDRRLCRVAPRRYRLLIITGME